MSIFHKSINERLLQHISQLDDFGLLPVDWIWQRDKIESLEELSEELLEDLMCLHNAHQDLGHTIPHIIPLIQELHTDIEVMLKNKNFEGNKRGKEVITVNRLVEHLRDSLEKQGYVRYGSFRGPVMYLTPKEIAYYNSLFDERKLKTALRYIKRKWNERVDRSFIQSVHIIHWGSFDKIEFAITKLSRRRELCCNAFLKPPYLCGWIGGLGLMINGYVTLAGNCDIQTNQWKFGQRERIQRYTERAEHLCLNRQTFIVPGSNGRHNEFIVDNWNPVGIVIDEKKINKGDYERILGKNPTLRQIKSFLKEFSTKYGLVLVDINGQRL